MKSMILGITSYLLWPLLFGLSLSIVYIGFELDREILFLVIAYFSLALILYGLEFAFPYREAWLQSDGQVIPDLAHTALTKGFGQLLLFIVMMSGIVSLVKDIQGGGFWPHNISMIWQVLIAMAAGEFGLYWAHRLAHTHDILWRFHAIHHSVEKLWFFNTGRFHFIDSLFKISLSLPIMIILGAPGDVLVWVSSVTVFVGFLTHCNVNMNCGIISYVFNTPNLHRWHHSCKAQEGNNNYGENLVIFDILFRTFYLPKDKEVRTIGVNDFMPEKFTQQLIAPFIWKKVQKEKPYPSIRKLDQDKS